MYELISVFIKSIYIAKLPYVTAGLSSIYDIADYFNLLLLSFFRPQVAKAAAIRWMISVVHISFLFFFFPLLFLLFIYLFMYFPDSFTAEHHEQSLTAAAFLSKGKFQFISSTGQFI